jgi:hypothetical protein
MAKHVERHPDRTAAQSSGGLARHDSYFPSSEEHPQWHDSPLWERTCSIQEETGWGNPLLQAWLFWELS